MLLLKLSDMQGGRLMSLQKQVWAYDSRVPVTTLASARG
jgi:hypothetical protein